MIGVITVNEREKGRSFTPFDTLIVIDCDFTNWEGVPDIIPVVELRDNPIGRDPDMIENDNSSPLTEGEIENGLFFDRTYSDWE